uniref:Uncharacterized protein n=1 Tax=Rangifer tarandus platyrhynchus TaxID=3082113 RepID=A0ACB0EA70_RANTA|nr:unnamed protein product [Rangifer tarandus platyrhynchus]
MGSRESGRASWHRTGALRGLCPARSRSWQPDPGCPFQTRKPKTPVVLSSRASLAHCAPGGLWDLNWCARRPPRFAAQRARAGRAEIALYLEAAARHLLSPKEGSSRGSPAPPVGARALCEDSGRPPWPSPG